MKKLYALNEETADILCLSLGTLRQYVSRGIIPAVYLGRKRAIPAHVIEEICAEGLDTQPAGDCSRHA